MGTRSHIVAAIKRLASAKRSGRYKSIRGQVNWLKWDFATFPFGLSITIPEEDDGGEAIEGTFNLQIVTKMPNPVEITPEQELILEEMRDDLYSILFDLEQELNPESTSDALIHGCTKLPSIEIADPDKELIGVSIAAILEY